MASLDHLDRTKRLPSDPRFEDAPVHIFRTRKAADMRLFAALTLIPMAALAAGALLATSAAAQSARDVRGASPYVAVDNEPPPRLIVDPPLPEGLSQGVFWVQYRVEHLHIAPVFGPGAQQVSPRVGHLHIVVDDGPWWWADTSDSNTVDIANLPPGPHKVKIALVDANHNVFPGQEVTVPFTIPNSAPGDHTHPSH